MSTNALPNLIAALPATDRTRHTSTALSITVFDQWSLPSEARVAPTGGTWAAAEGETSGQ